MKHLITGGAGFIGSNYIYYMQKEHPDVELVCLDSLTYAGNIYTLEDAMKKEGFKFVKGDITDRDAIFTLFETEGFDVVVNFAAESHVDRSILDPSVFLKTNILGTQNLLDACRKYGIRRLHQISTDEVYGDLPIERKDLLFSENNPIRTSSPYSASKAAADLLALAYYKTYDLPVTISRCSNNYGRFQFPEKLIPLMISNALYDKELPIYGTGENIRDWIFVEDHCEAVFRILTDGKEGEVYNIGGNEERSNIEVVRIILDTLGKSEDLIKFVADRPGHDRRYAINAEKIKNELGWEPKVSFEDGIKQTIGWYIENESWWEMILSGKYQEWSGDHGKE